MSDFVALWLQPSRLLCPWDYPGKNTGAGFHALLQGIFLCLRDPSRISLCLLHWQVGSLPLAPPGKPSLSISIPYFLRHNTETRPINNPIMASNCSSWSETSFTLSQKLKMIKSGEEAMLKVKKGQKLGLLNQIAKLRLQKKSSWRTFKVLLQ